MTMLVAKIINVVNPTSNINGGFNLLHGKNMYFYSIPLFKIGSILNLYFIYFQTPNLQTPQLFILNLFSYHTPCILSSSNQIINTCGIILRESNPSDKGTRQLQNRHRAKSTVLLVGCMVVDFTFNISQGCTYSKTLTIKRNSI